ncbi:MAG: hypothetical protein ABIT23_05330 [Nitrosospira sp.]
MLCIIFNTAPLLDSERGPIMSYPAISRNEVLRSLPLVTNPIFSILGLMLILFACGSVQAQSNPVDSPAMGQTGDEQYKPGKTPTGQEYGTIKKGEPHKGEAARKKPDSSNKKQESKPGPEAFTDRDKRETHEGSGPDPLGRY